MSSLSIYKGEGKVFIAELCRKSRLEAPAQHQTAAPVTVGGFRAAGDD